MMWQNYQLGNTVSKTSEAVTLWRMEKGIIEINKNTLAVPIELDDKERGYVFHGDGKFLLDSIVETEEGAIGQPVEKELSELFLMLGDTEEMQKHLTEASEEDFAKMNYKSQREFTDKADALYDQFFKKRRVHSHHGFDEDSGLVFAFQNEDNKLDILVSKGSNLVYKSVDLVFVSNKNRVVLKSPREVICSSKGKSVIIKK